MTEKRAVCLNCIDGRVQMPAIDWIKEHCQVDHVDMITEPGMDGLLAHINEPIDGILNKIKMSIEHTNAAAIVIVGHYDCKGNPASDADHKEQIAQSTERLKEEFGDREVIGLWINDQWQGEQI